MKRATPAQLHQSLEMANTMVKHGIRFVCMPVVYEADGMNLASQAAERLERMALIAEAGEERA
ncbi:MULTISPECIES: DUF1382 family protein [unclassified Pseudomonas]|uniref:DUF1382 family protein n=1 Tax=unclassified Pseudomonas TaxID=196821 RepID=UPI000C8866F4|nr:MULTISPECIES: DUF1382 family protein [unclassified Pseudomonas]PMX19118.1 hypothetical protein C1Y25_00505 [Pseudomonas sp. MPBC4-3]PMX50079.1 hypothetical protein C1Y20_04220 [Pseudomonas sp. FW301-21B01]PMY10795.1 hypothetical protein C1Y18_02050 [Pseudomonas sp. MPR-R5A]PNA72962.1 hypothetical protein C1Y14_01605 [Pseudomonas sp. MPR-R5B]